MIKTRIPLVFLIWLGCISLLWIALGYIDGRGLRDRFLNFIILWVAIAGSGILLVLIATIDALKCFRRQWRDEGACSVAIAAFTPLVVIFFPSATYRPMYDLGVLHTFEKTTEIRREVSDLISQGLKGRQFLDLGSDELPPHLRTLSEFGSLRLSPNGLTLTTGGTITHRTGYFIHPLHDHEADVPRMEGITRW